MIEYNLLVQRNLRDEVMNNERLDILDKVKEISYLPKTNYSVVEQVADYYEVGIEAVKSLVKRNREELESNGMKKYTKDEILRKVLNKFPIKQLRTKTLVTIDEKEIEINNTGLLLFNKLSILNVGILLEDSPIADKIKQELGIYIPRKELNFKNNLDKNLNYLKEEYIKRRKEIYLTQEPDTKMFEYDTQKYFGNNRVDFYFPYMNLIVEYDENYHENNKQKELDKRRETELLFELQKEFYNYDKEYYGSEMIDNIEMWSFVDEPCLYFDAVKEKDYYCCEESKEKNKDRKDYICNKCGIVDMSKLRSMGKIIRIKENEEEIGLMKILSYIMSEIKGF